MSEYFTGVPSDPDGPALAGQAAAGADGGADGAGTSSQARPAWWDGPEHVRFGVPFNDVVPIWHDGTEITWHRVEDGTDLSVVLGLGHVEAEPGPSPVPQGWVELVETGTLVAPEASDRAEASDGVGPVLVLRPAAPTGRRAQAAPGEGARVRLSAALSVQEAMGASASDFDITGFSVHVARLMLRAARDGAIMLFTLRAPRDPEAHHLLSAPSEVGEDGVMRFHLGTLLDVSAPSWAGAQHAEGMSLLDVEVAYASLLAGGRAGSGGEDDGVARPGLLGEGAAAAGEGAAGNAGAAGSASPAEGAGTGSADGDALDVERLVEMAQPVVDAILAPGFPFALGASFIVRA